MPREPTLMNGIMRRIGPSGSSTATTSQASVASECVICDCVRAATEGRNPFLVAELEHGALGRHEDVVDGEMMRPRAAHAADLPRVADRRLAARHEEISRLGLPVRLAADLALVDHLAVRRDPRRVPAPGAVALPRGDAVAAGHDDRQAFDRAISLSDDPAIQQFLRARQTALHERIES